MYIISVEVNYILQRIENMIPELLPELEPKMRAWEKEENILMSEILLRTENYLKEKKEEMLCSKEKK
ncbi:MAG: hypothetical protein AAF599_05345 [Bacteroidota bacterium]